MSIEPARVNGTASHPPAGSDAIDTEEARQEDIRRRTEAAQKAASVLGSIVAVMMHTPAFQRYSVGDLRWLVAPAVSSGQYSLAQARVKTTGEFRTIAVLLWASVSDEIDARLSGEESTTIRLSPDEWRSGPHLWVVEGIGERSIIAQQIRQLRQKDWIGRPVKIKVRGQDGSPVVRQLPAG